MSKLSADEKLDLEDELHNSESIAEMFEILETYYDLENCCPGTIVKKIIIKNLQTAVVKLNAKRNPEL